MHTPNGTHPSSKPTFLRAGIHVEANGGQVDQHFLLALGRSVMQRVLPIRVRYVLQRRVVLLF